MGMIYLDHNATSPLRPEAQTDMSAAFPRAGNPSSVHAAGRVARATIENARRTVAALARATPEHVVFTASGSEANALGLWGAALSGAVRRLLISAVEHASVLDNAALAAARCGLTVEILPVDEAGTVRLDVLRDRLNDGEPALVAVMAASNETGVLQPMNDVVALARSYGGFVLCDAVQAAGKIALPPTDYLTLAAHKIGGPQGVGALLLSETAPYAPLIRGGGQELIRRAGTENVLGIAGFGAAAAVADRDLGEGAVTALLRDRFEAGLRDLAPDATIFSAAAPRLPNTSFFAIPGMSAETALMALDLDGICVSRGAACSSGQVGTSHVLAAMGVPDALAACALRVSFGWNSTAADVETAIAAIARHRARLAKRAA